MKYLDETRVELIYDMPLNEIIYELMENKFVPILAHPERYSFVQKNPNFVYNLIQKGVRYAI